MKKSSWCKSRTHLSSNSDYALIPLSTDLFWNSVKHIPFIEQYPTPHLHLKACENSDLSPNVMKKFLHEPITCSYPRTSKCYDFWKRKTLESNINWTSEDKWIVFLFCVYRTKAAGAACPPASQPCHAISLHSHFKVWHQLVRTPSQPGISFQPSHFSPTTINFLFRLAQME